MEYTEDQMTPWFKAKPKKIGAYKTRIRKGETPDWWQWWDGIRFCVCAATPNGAKKLSGHASVFQGVEWRGLLARPATNDKE